MAFGEGKLSDWAEGRRFSVLAGLAESGFEEGLDGDRGRSADRYCDEQSRENGRYAREALEQQTATAEVLQVSKIQKPSWIFRRDRHFAESLLEET